MGRNVPVTHSRTEGSSTVTAPQGRGNELHIELPPLACFNSRVTLLPKTQQECLLGFPFQEQSVPLTRCINVNISENSLVFTF